VSERAHAVFSPSAAHRWLPCPGSLQPNLLAEGDGDGSSPYAEEGTAAHALAEKMLRGMDVVGDPVMLDYVRQYVDWANEAAADADLVLIEERVNFSAWTPLPNQFGTADHVAMHFTKMGGVCTITDLKYGMGVRVRARDNPQLMLYALGVLDAYDFIGDFKRFDLRICQPRLGMFDTWEVSRADLLAFGEYVKERSALALEPNAPRVAGEKQCKFCKVKASCPAQVDLLHQLAEDTFEAVEPTTAISAAAAVDSRPSLPAIADMTVAQKARILPYRKTVENWFKAMAEDLERRANDGETIPGYKMVAGRSRRQWTDEAGLATTLATYSIDPWDTSLVAPSEAERRMMKAGMKSKEAKAAVAALTTKPLGKPTLVPDSDERDEDDAGDVFDAV